MLVVSDDEADLRRRYGSVELAAPIECEYCLPELTRKSVWLCRDPFQPLAEEWAALEEYR